MQQLDLVDSFGNLQQIASGNWQQIRKYCRFRQQMRKHVAINTLSKYLNTCPSCNLFNIEIWNLPCLTNLVPCPVHVCDQDQTKNTQSWFEIQATPPLWLRATTQFKQLFDYDPEEFPISIWVKDCRYKSLAKCLHNFGQEVKMRSS